MDFGREAGFSGGNVGLITVPEIPSSNGFDQWVPGSGDQSIWATEDDYRTWIMGPSSETPSSSNYDDRPNQTLSGSEPPNKKSRNSLGGDSYMIVNNRSKAIGKMFFKTKLCCKFRAGVCPYVTNCNFAHGMEELRKPPFNWQEIVAAAREEGHGGVTVEPREEHQIPTFSSSDFRAESQRSYKGRHCKKFYTEEGCPYGDNCTFLHDEQSRARESVAISLSPTVGGEYGNNGNAPNLNLKPSNWKTRICNKWETTGHCPFGSKCHFAHGVGELHKYGGGLAEAEGMDSSSAPPDSNQGGVASKRMIDMVVVASTLSTPHSEVYHMGQGVPSQRLASNSGSTHQRLGGERSLQKWIGPDKISRIYGDWIDDIE